MPGAAQPSSDRRPAVDLFDGDRRRDGRRRDDGHRMECRAGLRMRKPVRHRSNGGGWRGHPRLLHVRHPADAVALRP